MINHDLDRPVTSAATATAYALNDQSGRAAAELAQARRLAGDDRYSSIARLRSAGPFGRATIRALFRAGAARRAASSGVT